MATYTAVVRSGHEQVWAFFKSEARAHAWCEAMPAEGYDTAAVTR